MRDDHHVFARELQAQFGTSFAITEGVGVVVLNVIRELVFLVLQTAYLSIQGVDLLIEVVIAFDGFTEDHDEIDDCDHADKVEGIYATKFDFRQSHYA